jgi:ferric-chelate reductase (NADPH)
MLKKKLSNLLVNLLIRKSTVLSNQKIGENFQLVTIKLSSKKPWFPGQKIQIKATASELRSYTPSKWHQDQRTFETLIYNHKSGPGALWAQNAVPGLKTQVVGPRNSLDIRLRTENIIFFGDETSFGLGAILKDNFTDKKISFCWEANEFNDSQAALGHLGLDTISLFLRNPKDTHLNFIKDHIQKIYTDELIILSGKKTSIDFLFKQLISCGIPKEAIMKKMYWGWKGKE